VTSAADVEAVARGIVDAASYMTIATRLYRARASRAWLGRADERIALGAT
jgi:hypothetical protein